MEIQFIIFKKKPLKNYTTENKIKMYFVIQTLSKHHPTSVQIRLVKNHKNVFLFSKNF